MGGQQAPGPVCRSRGDGIDAGTLCRHRNPGLGPAGARGGEVVDLESALAQMRTQAANFGYRFIADGGLRERYLRKTAQVAEAIRQEVAAGTLSPAEGAREANKIRNAVMDAARIDSSDIGRAEAQAHKALGRSLPELEAHYARKLFDRGFDALTPAQRNQVWREIVDASGRPRPAMNLKAARLARLGRGLVFVSVALAVYNVAAAEDKGRQAGKEAATAGAGVLGGMAGGAAAGLACGPGAPACVAVGVFVGGALAALGADLAFDWLW